MGMLIRRGWDWPGNECWLVLEETPSYYAPSWTKVYRARIDYGPVGTKVDLGEIVASGLKMIKEVASERARRHGFVGKGEWKPFEETVMNNPRRSRKPFRKVYIPVTCQTPGCPWEGHPFNLITYEGPSSGLDPFYESFGHGGGEAADLCPACKKLGLAGDPSSVRPKLFKRIDAPGMTERTPLEQHLGTVGEGIVEWGMSHVPQGMPWEQARTLLLQQISRMLPKKRDQKLALRWARLKYYTNNPVQNPSCPQCGGEGAYLGNLGAWEWFRCIQCGWEFSPMTKAKRKVLRRRRGGFSEASHYLTENPKGVGRQLCVHCGKPSIPGLKKGQGLCQYHYTVWMFGKEWADEVRAMWKPELPSR